MYSYQHSYIKGTVSVNEKRETSATENAERVVKASKNTVNREWKIKLSLQVLRNVVE